MSTTTTLPTENEAWGFYGTCGQHGLTQGERIVAWAEATRQLRNETGEELEHIRAFLDSAMGRHFADAICGDIKVHGQDVRTAVAATIEKWMTWRITRSTSKSTGIPAGLPYLTGFIISAGIEADAAKEG